MPRFFTRMHNWWDELWATDTATITVDSKTVEVPHHQVAQMAAVEVGNAALTIGATMGKNSDLRSTAWTVLAHRMIEDCSAAADRNGHDNEANTRCFSWGAVFEVLSVVAESVEEKRKDRQLDHVNNAETKQEAI